MTTLQDDQKTKMMSKHSYSTVLFPPFNPRGWRYHNIVTSGKATSNNSTRCWMNIGVDKLARFAGDDKWLFDCYLNNERRVYYTEVRVLREAFKKANLKTIKNGTERYSFFFDYTKGIIYSCVTRSTAEQLLKLQEVKSKMEYENYKKHI